MDTYSVLSKSKMKFAPTLQDLIKFADLILVAVSTNNTKIDGGSYTYEERYRNDYSALLSCLKDINEGVEKLEGQVRNVAVFSTTVPGTVKKPILPLLSDKVNLCYNPLFVALGSVMFEFLTPEFVLLGLADEGESALMIEFYSKITDAPISVTNFINAELVKLAYNAFIGMKITFANTLMEICHKIPGCNVGIVTDALKLGKSRITSGAYFSGGMGDGGSRHMIDHLELPQLARELNISFDVFDVVVRARERQTMWLADLMEEYKHLPFVILGKAFKSEIDVASGSPAALLRRILEERGHNPLQWDPVVDRWTVDFQVPCCFVKGTNHGEFRKIAFPEDSGVIDPWRYMPQQKGVHVIQCGRWPKVT